VADGARRRAAVVVLCAATASGCALRGAHPAAPAPPRVADRLIVLNDHPLRLHFAAGTRGPGHPLLVYATGDGGWHRKDLAAYRHLVSAGDPTVGFDAHDYVTHLGVGDSTTPAHLAADYERIITAAKETLQLPAGYPVVLVGVSRGAGLSVVAAAQRPPRPSSAGVLAGALTKEEEYVKRRRLPLAPRRAPAPAAVMVEVYDYLPRLAGVPVAVIQSTRDHYLPAAAARTLFGPDTPRRWFQAIAARNHSFGGARGELYAAIARALDWLTPSSSASSRPSTAVPRG
jgi:pimeloyl-ACP methyl ester carboxylesterase